MKCFATIALICILGCGSGREQISSPDHPVVKAFIASKSVLPVWSKNVMPPVKEWNEVLDLGGNLTLRITGLQLVGGKFYGQYSDEKELRFVGSPGDYVYPCALRIDLPNMKVYGLASGLAGGFKQVTALFEFDIRSRKIIHSYHVDPRFLPPDPSPLAKPA